MGAESVACPTCGEPASWRDDAVWSTLVYYVPQNGHHHDDNCRTREYRCKGGHRFAVSVRNRCSTEGCDWRGRASCFCHAGARFDAWPEVRHGR